MAWSWRAGILICVGVIPVIFFPSHTLVWGWIVVVAALCVADAFAALNPRWLTLTREVSGPLRANEETSSVVTVTNPTTRVARIELRDAWPPSTCPSPSHHRVIVRPAAVQRLVTTLRPSRRGTMHADYVTVRVWGPLGLGARQISFAAPVSVSVLPEFRARRILPSRLARLHELEGSTAMVLRGAGTEFDSLREYVHGDDPRDIDWRACARSKELIVRTWRPERDRHVVLVMDTGRGGAMLLGAPDSPSETVSSSVNVSSAASPNADRIDIGEAPRLDSEIETALLLSALADRAGDHVHLLAVDRSVHARISRIRGAHLMRHCAEALAHVTPSMSPISWSLVASEIARTVHHRSLVVLITPVPPAGSDTGFFEAIAQLSSRHTVIVASATDPDVTRALHGRSDADEVFLAAAASVTQTMDEAGIADAQRAGAIVVSADSGLLPARTADAYVALKKMGRL